MTTRAPVFLPDPKEILFNQGLAYLASISDRTPNSFRPIVGRWLSRCGDPWRLVALLARAEAENVADPTSWVERMLKTRPEAMRFATSGAVTAFQRIAASGVDHGNGLIIEHQAPG